MKWKIRKYKNYERYGQIFSSRKKASVLKKILDKSAKEGDLNLRHRILRKGKKYILTTESKRKSY